MVRGSATRLVTLSSVLLVLWGIAYIILSNASMKALGPAEAEVLRVEWVSKGILIIFVGMVLFQTPPLLKRGEFQGFRLATFTLFFLIVLTVWHVLKSPLDTVISKGTPIILGLCSLLLLAAIIQLRRGLRLPRL